MNTKNTKEIRTEITFTDISDKRDERHYSLRKNGDEFILTDLMDEIEYFIPAKAIEFAEELETKSKKNFIN